MPINKIDDDSKNEYISRCVNIEIDNGYDINQAYAKWENMNADEKGIWKAAKFFKIMNLKK